MNQLKQRFFLRTAVKSGLDNLPSGVCFFSQSGIAVLCNHQMTHLFFTMTGHDLQVLSDLTQLLDAPQTENGAVREGTCFLLPDGSAWRFAVNQITTGDGHTYTEAIAADVTELREKQRQLTEANEAKKQTVEALERIRQNVVAITREEELLSMKMRLHNEFGYNLQTIRRYFQRGCPGEEKADFLAEQKKMLQKMRGELESDAADDPLTELRRLARSLDMEIVFSGQIPREQRTRALLACILRESLTNTSRHAQGDRVFAALTECGDSLTVRVTNNGRPPKAEITKGGGLSSLQTRLARCGGTMTVRGLPEFVLTAVIPMRGERV